MRIRPSGLALLAGLSIIVAACGTGAESSAPAASEPAASEPAASEPAASEPAASEPATSDLKIGVVTDVGTVNDKNFNEYTYVGAQLGAEAIGAEEPPVVVPTAATDYAPLIQAYIDEGFDIIIAAGFALTNDTAAAAKANPDIWFIGVDHAPCLDAEGNIDPSFGCAGDMATLLPKYIGLVYAEDQAGYLAGIVAASIEGVDTIGAIGGVSLCGPCIRYIQGYELGAKSVNPEIVVKAAWVSDSDFVLGFQNQAAGKDFAQQFVQQNEGMDVLFQVAGLTGNGVLDAACEAGLHGIGVDVDMYLSYPASQPCIVTSAEKKLANSVVQTIEAISGGTAAGGLSTFDATNDGIGVAPFYEAESRLAADTQAKVDEAFAAMVAGTLETCPADTCGSQDGLADLGD